MSANNLVFMINKILDPIKQAIPFADYKYLKFRMLELGGVKVGVGQMYWEV